MRLVIKIGSSTLTHRTGKLNIRLVEEMCKVISDIKNAGHEIVIVSSGAIALGMGKLNISKRPNDMPTKQAAAAVGQCELMYTYDKMFSEYGHTVAQILITKEDIADAERKNHFENTIFRLLEIGAMPIINENDTVSTAEISVGDNDTLAAHASVCAKANLLVLISDIDGMYSSDPRRDANAKLIPIVNKIDENIIQLAGGAGSALGTGGMATKIKAADICLKNGIDMLIINGNNPAALYGAINGEDVGTRFKAQ